MSGVPEPRQAMPTAGYTSPAWFDQEQEMLFGKVWSFAGMTEDLSEPGDYVCVEAGPYPLVVLLDKNRELRAFHNICRHRGSKLLDGSGNTGRGIRCFYHNWTYDLAGKLKSVPQEKDQFPGLDKKCLGLHPAKPAVWKNLVFVHPDPDAEPLDDWFAGVAETLGPHQPENLVEMSRAKYRFRANWKIVIENFIDGYHFAYLHPVSLGDGDFSRQNWEPRGRHWTFYRPLKPGVTHAHQLMPVIDGVDPAWGASSSVMFPNLAIFETATFWLTFHVLPVAADESIVDIRSRAMPEAVDRLKALPKAEGRSPDYVISSAGVYALDNMPDPDVHPTESDDVMMEDIYACEAVQKGMNSPLFEVGPMSKYESSLTFFQQQVLDYMPPIDAPGTKVRAV
ncbi:MAG: aromatic ring-hydroxylating dioxygenase subunit alpha [Alphaproteobacteria bacterium]